MEDKREETGIVNRVASSTLVTFNLEDYYQPGERILIDVSDQLYQGLVLREKDFRDFIRTHNWSQYQNKFVAIVCSSDAIVPTWAYMLVAIALQPYAQKVVFGSLEQLEIEIFLDRLQLINWLQFANTKVVLKGCSKVYVPMAVYIEATNQLSAVASSLMYGEPCSTVPLFKRSKPTN